MKASSIQINSHPMGKGIVGNVTEFIKPNNEEVNN